ncbi:MAG TPA: orotidine 5'-phosphate decarboxylase / HUMPS family protein, partial [Candidatus Binataceae bacterium]
MPNHYWSLSALTRHASVRERLIVALDMTDCDAALAMVGRLANEVNIFKVGRKLFASAGPGVIREIRRRGSEVFLDLKFHDTPHRVERASIGATRLGVRMFSIHPYCKLEMMTRTRAEVAKVCRLEGLRRPEIIAVAMLAGINTASCDAADDIADPVAHLASYA